MSERVRWRPLADQTVDLQTAVGVSRPTRKGNRRGQAQGVGEREGWCGVAEGWQG